MDSLVITLFTGGSKMVIIQMEYRAKHDTLLSELCLNYI